MEKQEENRQPGRQRRDKHRGFSQNSTNLQRRCAICTSLHEMRSVQGMWKSPCAGVLFAHRTSALVRTLTAGGLLRVALSVHLFFSSGWRLAPRPVYMPLSLEELQAQQMSRKSCLTGVGSSFHSIDALSNKNSSPQAAAKPSDPKSHSTLYLNDQGNTPQTTSKPLSMPCHAIPMPIISIIIMLLLLPALLQPVNRF